MNSDEVDVISVKCYDLTCLTWSDIVFSDIPDHLGPDSFALGLHIGFCGQTEMFTRETRDMCIWCTHQWPYGEDLGICERHDG